MEGDASKTYKCWRRSCKLHLGEDRILEEDLIERQEDIGHKDLCCPECESVIICITEED